MAESTPLSVSAPAKLNLILRVGPLRSDGFHEVRTLTARIGLHDHVSLRRVAPDDPRRRAEDPVVGLTCDVEGISTGSDNLAWRAALALRDHVRARSRAADTLPPIEIGLQKRIPAGAGLGGGSSDAAAVLQLLNRAWGLELDWRELASIGARLGSDVPLFLAPAPVALGVGRGADVTPLAGRIAGWAAVLLSGVHCSTPDVYRRFDQLAPAPPKGESSLSEAIARLEQARPNGRPVLASECRSWLANDLEPAAFAMAPALSELAARVEAATGLRPRLTGSGSAMFGLFDTQEAAAQYGARARHAAVGIGVALAPLEQA